MKSLFAISLAVLGCTDDPMTVDPDPPDDPGPMADVCPSNLTVTTAMRLDIPTHWDPEDPEVTVGIPGYAAGNGTSKFWLLQTLTFDETNVVAAKIRACGSLLPPVTKIVGYEGDIVMDAPTTSYDLLPELETSIAFSGVGPGATFDVPPQALVLGVDVTASEPWPADWNAPALRGRLTDPDRDGLPGFSLVPQTGPGLVPPITVLSATNNPSAPTTAAKVGVALRAQLAIAGAREGCTGASGTATVVAYEGQVVSCEQADGDLCTTGQAAFVDEHTPVFRFDPGTFEMALINGSGATCLDVRTALP